MADQWKSTGCVGSDAAADDGDDDGDWECADAARVSFVVGCCSTAGCWWSFVSLVRTVQNRSGPDAASGRVKESEWELVVVVVVLAVGPRDLVFVYYWCC